MKRSTAISNLFLALSFVIMFSSCATVLGGKVSDCQRTKPQAGQPTRKVRAGALIADIILIPIIGLIVDFSTGAIYRPCEVPQVSK